LPKETEIELGSVLAALMFFGLGDRVDSFVAEALPGETVAEATTTIHELFPGAVEQYASLGRILEEAHRRIAQEAQDPPVRLPGRKDPCPCGSGKKLKRCCGMPRH
jgi:uncharacterized protein YecA (UPF0149 family)